MAQITPEDEIIYTAEDRPGKPERQVSYDDCQHSGLILWMFIALGLAFMILIAVITIGYLRSLAA